MYMYMYICDICHLLVPESFHNDHPKIMVSSFLPLKSSRIMSHWPSLHKLTSESIIYLWAVRVCNLGEIKPECQQTSSIPKLYT